MFELNALYKNKYNDATVRVVGVFQRASLTPSLVVKDKNGGVTYHEEIPFLREFVYVGTVRPSWDTYFTQMARLVATRATCDRRHVGAVVARDHRVLATGYNGSPPGLPHCDQIGHDLVTLADGSVNCVRTTHAEANAIFQAAKIGVSLDGATLYTNTYPCWNCAKAILGAGIVKVCVDADYNNDPRVQTAFVAKEIEVVRYHEEEF